MDQSLFLQKAVQTGVYFQLLHPIERIVYTVNTLCNQIAEKKLWERFRPEIMESMRKGMKQGYGINHLTLQEMKEITVEVLNRPEVRQEIEAASPLRCLICGEKCGRWYITIQDRRIESARREKRWSADFPFFSATIPSTVEDNEEYCYALHGAVDYWEALLELVTHLIYEHGQGLGRELLGKEKWDEGELVRAVWEKVIHNLGKVLAEQLFLYERVKHGENFSTRRIGITRKRVKAQETMTPDRLKKAFTEGRLREFLGAGYYDLEVLFYDDPSLPSAPVKRKPLVGEARRRACMERIISCLGERVTARIQCEECENEERVFSSPQELITHYVHSHPEIALGKSGARKMVRECTPIAWLYEARFRTVQRVFVYLGPHYVDMLPPLPGRSVIHYEVEQAKRSKIYESYTAFLGCYRKYLRGRRSS